MHRAMQKDNKKDYYKRRGKPIIGIWIACLNLRLESPLAILCQTLSKARFLKLFCLQFMLTYLHFVINTSTLIFNLVAQYVWQLTSIFIFLY